ncbi:MAG: hypothetical protein ACLFM7_11615 [Bacteroidales bacterium]
MLINHGTWQGKQILKKNTVKQMFREGWRYNGSNGDNYHGLFRSWGLGIHRITGMPDQDVILRGSDTMYGHSGFAYGLLSNAYCYPVRKTGLIFITNGKANGYIICENSSFY